jgi:hypothetical protein
MGETITCSCGYSGPGRVEGPVVVCPLCGELAGQVAAKPKQWRIPCPNGHVFKVGDDWIGRQMVCPKCNEPFVPQIADSIERRDEERQRQEQAEAKFAKKWLTIAIWAAALFGLLIVSLIVLTVVRA